MPRKAKSPARAEATGDWDHREAAPASQLDAFGFRKKSAYTPDDAHKVDAQMAKWVAEGKYSDTQGATGSFNDFYVKQLHKIPRPKKTINQEAWAFVLFLSTNLTALLTYARVYRLSHHDTAHARAGLPCRTEMDAFRVQKAHMRQCPCHHAYWLM